MARFLLSIFGSDGPMRTQTGDGIRGRSNIDNAAHHRYAKSNRLIDIADFYPNCSANKVAEFFSKTLRCDPDIVAKRTSRKT